MPIIDSYGGSATKTSTGEKWSGMVIAVPRGWKTGVEYEITLANGQTVRARAVDVTPDGSFSMPKNGELAKLAGRQNITIKPVGDVVAQTKAQAQGQNNPPTQAATAVSDIELAAFLTKNTSVKDMVCEACIDRNRSHLPEFAKAVAGKPEYVAALKAALKISDAELAAQSSGFSEAAGGLQSCNIKDAPKAVKADIIAGAYYGFGGENPVVPFGQAGAKFGAFNLGASIRPESYTDGRVGGSRFNPLELNYETELGDWKIKSGLSTWVQNFNAQRDPFATTSTLSCGCSGAGSGEVKTPLRDQVLSPVLGEVSMAGVHGEKIFNDGKTFFRAGVGVPVNNEILNSRMAAVLAIRHKATDKIEAALSATIQDDERMVVAGASWKFSDTTKASVSAYNYEGHTNRTGVEARIEKQDLLGIKKLAGALTGVIEKDHDTGDTNYTARAALSYPVAKNVTVGPVVSVGNKEKFYGLGGGVSF